MNEAEIVAEIEKREIVGILVVDTLEGKFEGQHTFITNLKK